MKNFVRLCALFCMLAMLLGAVACTNAPRTPGADSSTSAPAETDAVSTESLPSTTPGTDDETTTETRPESVPDTGTETETEKEEETASETVPETVSETEPEPETVPETVPTEDVSLPDDYVCLYEGERLTGISMADLSGTVESDEDGTSYMIYRPKSNDPRVYFADGMSDNRLSGVRYVRIKYRTDKVTQAQLFVGNEKESDEGRADLALVADGAWHVVTVDLMVVPVYAKTLSIFRFDPMENRKSGTLQVAAIALYSDDGAPDPRPDPLEALPELPEDAPNLTEYTKFPQSEVYYKVAGGDNGTFTFREGFKMDLYSHEYFNRFTIRYESTSPLRGDITYAAVSGEKRITHTETFFLEAGQNMSFSSLIDGYFDGAYAYNIKEISLKTADNSTTEFTIRKVDTNTVPVITAGTYYMENDRYIVGVLLEWGGTISYIEDKKDNDPDIGNLINRYDPGRLVQQSYYGVGDGPHYTAGYYNGTQWRYNPVQGGNLTGKPSKLVDFNISGDGKTVYIKCRPQDWAQENSLTPSYMENTYTLYEDGVHVANRFVDFFGVAHGKRHAELPAFYTISHLGVFHYYNGTKPWTGDAYETLPNEPDWAGNKACYHNMVKGNTETWAAWTNTAGYGIGLYVPGTEIMYAGRHAHNGSKDPYNGATNYVAPLRTMEFFSFVPFEYEYFISTGTVDEMRETFKNHVE